jgi:Peptidase_C39 like family
MNFKKLFALSFALSNVVFSGNASNATQGFSPVPNDRMTGLIAQCANTHIGANNYGKGSTWRTCTGYTLAFQGDGNLVMYNPSGRPIWATGTNGYAQRVAFQGDGNVVLYDGNNRAIWATNTDGRGRLFAFQADGNFVVYDGNGRAVYSTGTYGGQVRTVQAAYDWGWRPTVANSGSTISVSQANQVFKTQYNSGYNQDGPSASNNCGPASVAMIMKLLGKEPANLSTQASINVARQYMGMVGNGYASDSQVVAGLRRAGLQVANHMYDGTWQQLDQDLAAGRPVVAWGFYGAAWRNQFPSYSLTGSGNTDHLNTILGKTANGNYLVADPMYRGGAVEMNRSQLAVFFSNGGGGHDGRPYFITAAR